MILQANATVVSLAQNALRDIQLHLSLAERLFLMRGIYIVWKSYSTLRKVHKQAMQFLHLEQLPLLPRFSPPRQIWSFLPLAPLFVLVPASFKKENLSQLKTRTLRTYRHHLAVIQTTPSYSHCLQYLWWSYQ